MAWRERFTHLTQDRLDAYRDIEWECRRRADER